MVSLPIVSSITKVDWTTCKLIFPFDTITEDGVRQLLSQYTQDFNIANFYPDRQIGRNRMSFAIVDVSLKVMQQLAENDKVSQIDPMKSYIKTLSESENKCCGGGKCGCSP